MQERYHDGMNRGDFSWGNMSVDGWGVRINTYNEDVTSKLCTYINNKPIVSTSLMTYKTKTKSIDLSSYNTDNVVNMSMMFEALDTDPVLNLDLSSFNTSNVTNMSYMFYKNAATTLDLSSFDTSKVTDMSGMFYKNTNLKTIYASDKFNTNSVSSSSNMFYNSTKLVGGAGTTYNSSYVDKTYARIDGGTSSPGYFTLKNN